MGVYSEMAADLRDNVQDRSPAIQDAAELASRRADDRQQAEEEQAKALLSQMQQNADDSPSPSNLKADKKAEEDRKRQEHEQAEAKRKAEWEARQRAKEEAEQAAWENAVAMSDDEVMAASMKRVGDDSERLTRRNMKQCVTEYIQTLCLEDVAFARNVMHPRKNMVNCFRYINRKALEFAKQEMEDNDVKPSAEGYGTDVPDGLCYQWAEDYFKDMNAKEDRGQEEKFVPKPYYGGRSSTTKKAEKKKAEKPAAKAEEKPADTPTEAAPLDEQISFDSTSMDEGENTLTISGLASGAKILHIIAKDTSGNTMEEPLEIIIPAYNQDAAEWPQLIAFLLPSNKWSVSGIELTADNVKIEQYPELVPYGAGNSSNTYYAGKVILDYGHPWD